MSLVLGIATTKWINYLIIPNMKAISVKQPWASLIVSGVKDIEN